MKRLQIINQQVNSQQKPVLCQKQGKIAIITLNRPQKLNSINQGLIFQLTSILHSLQYDHQIHVVIIKGAGKNFSVGADLKMFAGLPTTGAILRPPLQPLTRSLSEFKKPMIAAVHGYALGGGNQIAMLCDIILADKGAKFGQPQIKLGLIPGAGGTQRLTRAIGKFKAMHMMLVGDPISAYEAFEMGLVVKVCDDVFAEAMKVAQKIAGFSLPAVILCKNSINFSQDSGIREGLVHEYQLFNTTFGFKDKEEGIKALLEKRKPSFKNE